LPETGPNATRLNQETTFDLFGQKVLVIVGKGGTGRTTVARILAELGTRSGKKISVIAGTSGTHFSDQENPLLSFSSLEPGEVLISYLNDHGLGQVGKRLSSTGLASIISTAIPGIADLLVLAKIKQMERSDSADLIIFDAPASGHFLQLIATPKGLSDIAAAGPLQKQSREVLDMLSDPKRLGVALVTTAEETPVKESIETVEQLSAKSGIKPRVLFVNSVLPSLISKSVLKGASNTDTPAYRAAQYSYARAQLQREFEKLATEQLGLGLVEIPLVPTVELADSDIIHLADAIEPRIRVGL